MSEEAGMPRRIAITGASGMIGTALSAHLTGRGDDVLHLVRRPPRTPAEIRWDPASRSMDAGLLSGVDAVVHLAGAGVGDHRWTPAYKKLILTSRVDSTLAIANAVAQLAGNGQPVSLVSASATGFYGSERGDETLTEDSAPGSGFLVDVVQAWEAAADPARAAGVRVVHPRTGLVMSARGGAFERLLQLAAKGLGGPLGSGQQWWSWLTMRDEIRALAFLIDNPAVSGPVNLVSPTPQRQADIATALGAALHRPALVPAPAIALKLVLGEFARDVVGSARVLPRVLTASGFTFEHDRIDAGVRWLVDQR